MLNDKRIVAATGNKGKLREIQEILSDFEIISMKDLGINVDVEENGDTFRENAYIKAKEISKLTNLPVISDDSGLSVDALSGKPGVYTARFAGVNATDDENIDKLLFELKSVPDAKRTARFVSVVCLVLPDGACLYGEGACEGIIINERKGENGFGYDPVFYVPSFGKTFAELTSEEKNSISHRKKSLDDLKRQLEK